MDCDLKEGKICELKELFSGMTQRQEAFEMRQKSFEARQAKNEISIANTDKNVAIIQKDSAETSMELKALSSRVNVNTEQLIEIKKNIEPITEGVADIRTAVKPWLWVIRKFHWIMTTIVAGWVLFMDGIEHLKHFFDGQS